MADKNENGPARIETAENLTDYIRVESSGIVILVVAVLMVTAAVLVWGFIGKIPVISTVNGMIVDSSYGDVRCFVPAENMQAQFLQGKDLTVKTIDREVYNGYIDSTWDVPRKLEEFDSDYNLSGWEINYIKDVPDEYFYLLNIRTDEDISQHWMEMAEVNIVTREVSPIELLFH